MGRSKFWAILALFLLLAGCAVAAAPYRITKGTVKGGIWTVKTTYKVVAGTTVASYKIGGFSYEVVKAPVDWALTNDIENIGGLHPKEAIRQGRVKNSPYTVKGTKYYPMSVAASQSYRETGIASWYGWETRRQADGHMTANGEAFNPLGLTAAHRYLPLPTYVKVTNLENGRSLIVRVNDRGPFPSVHNARSGDRIIDLSLGAARKLGFEKQGLARVRVETIQVAEGPRLAGNR
jgi:rare lipoprotein A